MIKLKASPFVLKIFTNTLYFSLKFFFYIYFKEIEKFKQTDPIKFKDVKGIHVHQKVFSQVVTFSVKPNSNKKLKNVVDKLKSKFDQFKHLKKIINLIYISIS